MAIALLFIGALFLTTAIKGNHRDLFKLLKKDFTGDTNFIYWSLAIIVLVSIGNVRAIKPVSDALLVLVVIGVIVAQYRGGKDLFGTLIQQIKEGTK